MKTTNEKTRKTGLGRNLDTLLAESKNLTAAERSLLEMEPAILRFVERADLYTAIDQLDRIVHDLGCYAELAEVEAIERDLLAREALTVQEAVHLMMCEVYKRLREKYPEIG